MRLEQGVDPLRAGKAPRSHTRLQIFGIAEALGFDTFLEPFLAEPTQLGRRVLAIERDHVRQAASVHILVVGRGKICVEVGLELTHQDGLFGVSNLRPIGHGIDLDEFSAGGLQTGVFSATAR